MGIQGYASHLLEHHIVVETITILFQDDDNMRMQTTMFDGEIVKIPTIQKFKYDPDGFNDTDVIKFQPMNLTPGCADSYDQQPERHNVQGLQHCYVGLYTPNEQVGQICFRYYSERGEQKYHSGIKKPLREIYNDLQKDIDKNYATTRKDSMTDRYLTLKMKLNLPNELIKHSENLSVKVNELEAKQHLEKEALMYETDNYLTELMSQDYEKKSDQIKKCIDDFRNNGLKLTKLKKESSAVLASSQDETLVMDCSWEAYFNSDLCFLGIQESATDSTS